MNKRLTAQAVAKLPRLLFLQILLLTCVSASFATRRERLPDTWRPVHYSIQITLDERLSEVAAARVDIDILAIKQLSVVDLDFADLTTDAVKLGDRTLSFEHKNSLLEIHLPETLNAGKRFTLTVVYHGKPKDGLILTSDKDGKPSAIGDNWPNRVHHWIPSLDHPSAKATVTFTVTTPKRDLVVANGRLDKVETIDDSRRTWTYNESVPIPPYCMIIGVGEFSRLEPSEPSLSPLSYYVPQSDSQYAMKGFSPAAPSLQLFTRLVAPYPFEKLALIIGATRFGGMENSSAIVFTSTLLKPRPADKMSKAFGIPDGIEDVVAHEIAHQWFGDSVTESTWADLWLSEGFATYFAAIFIQEFDGEEAFQAEMKKAADMALAYEKKNPTPIHDRETEDLFKLLNPNNYQKGAWVLHMLRSQLGDEVFFRGIRKYYEVHKNSIAGTDDLRVALEQVSGRNLKAFFTRWVYETGHAQYELTWSWQKKSKDLKLVLAQVQPGSVFLDPVPLTITTAKHNQVVTILPTGKVTTRFIRLQDQPTAVEFDPNNTLLKEASVKSGT